MENFSLALKDSLFHPTADIALEFAEIGIDAVLENEALKAIPFVNSITAVCKVGLNLHERNLIKQTIAFINGFNSGTISQERLKEYQQMLNSNSKKAEKEFGRVMLLLGSNVDDIQSKVLGSFYVAYVSTNISWSKFCELSEANRRMFISDYQVLKEAADNNGLDINDRELYQVDRLISLGMLQNGNRLGGSVWIDLDDPAPKSKDIIITSFGRTFYKYLPQDIKNSI